MECKYIFLNLVIHFLYCKKYHIFKGILSILLLFTCGSSLNAKPSKTIDGVEIGISEKGANINLINNISNKNQLTFGFHYFDGNIANLEYSLIEPVPILYSSKGLRFSFKRYLNSTTKESGFFTKLGLDLSSLEASSTIDLGSQIYDVGSFTLTCRTCGKAILKTDNSQYKFIPSLILGWQQKINENFRISIGAGIQYFESPDIILDNAKGDDFPPYVRKKINSIIDNTNKELDKYGNIIPTITINTSFVF